MSVHLVKHQPGTIGVLDLQGGVHEHLEHLERLGLPYKRVKQASDFADLAGLIIPGGESTTMGKLLNEWNMLEPLRQRILDGMPVYGSCAGLILLCREIENSDQPRLGVLDATVRRNAFGRQVDSFETDLNIPEIGGDPIPAVFIRAPVLTGVGAGVTVLAEVNGQAVAVRQNNILATSFHPELTPDTRMHSYFLSFCSK